MTADQFAGLLDAHPHGGGWSARCPAHADNSPSLSIDEGDDGRILLYCHAGCQVRDILIAMKLTWSDLWPDDEPTEDFVWKNLARKYERRDRTERWWVASGYLEED